MKEEASWAGEHRFSVWQELESRVVESGERIGGQRSGGGRSTTGTECRKRKKKGGAVLIVGMGTGLKCWGAEIYMWRGLQRGSRGKQPGPL